MIPKSLVFVVVVGAVWGVYRFLVWVGDEVNTVHRPRRGPDE